MKILEMLNRNDASMQEYTAFQISASEAMRRGCDPGLLDHEKKEYFDEARHYALKGFSAAGGDPFLKLLSMSQATAASNLKILVDMERQAKIDSTIQSHRGSLDNELYAAIFGRFYED